MATQPSSGHSNTPSRTASTGEGSSGARPDLTPTTAAMLNPAPAPLVSGHAEASNASFRSCKPTIAGMLNPVPTSPVVIVFKSGTEKDDIEDHASLFGTGEEDLGTLYSPEPDCLHVARRRPAVPRSKKEDEPKSQGPELQKRQRRGKAKRRAPTPEDEDSDYEHNSPQRSDEEIAIENQAPTKGQRLRALTELASHNSVGEREEAMGTKKDRKRVMSINKSFGSTSPGAKKTPRLKKGTARPSTSPKKRSLEDVTGPSQRRQRTRSATRRHYRSGSGEPSSPAASPSARRSDRVKANERARCARLQGPNGGKAFDLPSSGESDSEAVDEGKDRHDSRASRFILDTAGMKKNHWRRGGW